MLPSVGLHSMTFSVRFYVRQLKLMAKSISVRQKKRGRPATGQAAIIGVRLSRDLLIDLDQWAVDNDLSRSEAIRRLIERALKEKRS